LSRSSLVFESSRLSRPPPLGSYHPPFVARCISLLSSPRALSVLALAKDLFQNVKNPFGLVYCVLYAPLPLKWTRAIPSRPLVCLPPFQMIRSDRISSEPVFPLRLFALVALSFRHLLSWFPEFRVQYDPFVPASPLAFSRRIPVLSFHGRHVRLSPCRFFSPRPQPSSSFMFSCLSV